jgi:hypothetical protein
MKLTYPGPHPVVRLTIGGEQCSCSKGGSLDVPAEDADQLMAQGWQKSTPPKKGTGQ